MKKWSVPAAICALLAVGTPHVQALARQHVIVGYYMGEMPVSKIPASMLTHLIYSFAEPGPDNTCIPPSAQARQTLAQLHALRDSNPGLRVTVSIGGWSAAKNYSNVALTARSRAAFASSCIDEYVIGPGLDGIDIDWEFPVSGGDTGMINRPQDRADVTLLLRELRRQLDALGKRTHRHYLLTAAIPAGRWQSAGPYDPARSYDLGAVARIVDWMNVMTYDMNQGFSPVSGFNSPLYPDPPSAPVSPLQRKLNNIAGAVQYFEDHGVPPDKIALGVPFYGRGFMNVSSKNAGLYSKYKGIYDETPWSRVENELLKDPAWERHWSAAAQVPWIYNPRHHIFFSYDDPHSIRLKAEFARRKHLLGTMFWVLGEDDDQNSLLKALQP